MTRRAPARDPVSDAIHHISNVWADHPGHAIHVKRYALITVMYEGRRIDARTIPLDPEDE